MQCAHCLAPATKQVGALMLCDRCAVLIAASLIGIQRFVPTYPRVYVGRPFDEDEKTDAPLQPIIIGSE